MTFGGVAFWGRAGPGCGAAATIALGFDAAVIAPALLDARTAKRNRWPTSPRSEQVGRARAPLIASHCSHPYRSEPAVLEAGRAIAPGAAVAEQRRSLLGRSGDGRRRAVRRSCRAGRPGARVGERGACTSGIRRGDENAQGVARIAGGQGVALPAHRVSMQLPPLVSQRRHRYESAIGDDPVQVPGDAWRTLPGDAAPIPGRARVVRRLRGEGRDRRGHRGENRGCTVFVSSRDTTRNDAADVVASRRVDRIGRFGYVDAARAVGEAAPPLVGVADRRAALPATGVCLQNLSFLRRASDRRSGLVPRYVVARCAT